MPKQYKLLALLVISIWILVACTLSSQKEGATEKSEFDDLPNHIGDVSKQHEPPSELSGAFNEGLSRKTEYEDRTNKWFETGFSISAGKLFPGDQVRVRLTQHPDDLKLRYQLTERNSSLEKIDLIKEEISSSHQFTAKLPDKEGTLYLLSVEVLDQNDQVEDTFLSLVAVPIQSMNAKLYTDKQTYRAGDRLTLYIENFGPTTLSFGTPYYIEQYENNEWKRLTFKNMNFDSIGLILESHDIYEQSIRLPSLSPGQYRIIKDISGDGTDLEATLAAVFDVE